MTKREEVVASITNAKFATKELMNEAYYQIYGDRWTTKTHMDPYEFSAKWDRYQHKLYNHCYEQAALSLLPDDVNYAIQREDGKFTVLLGSGMVIVTRHDDLACAITLGTLNYLLAQMNEVV